MAIYRQSYKLGGKPVLIRNAEPDDAAMLIERIRQNNQETPFLMHEPGEFAMTVEGERAFIEARRDSDNELLLVAVSEARLIGSCGASFGSMRRIRHAGEIGIAVARAHWGIGIGRALMESALGWLRDNAVERVSLTVDTENQRAISLYMRLGFTVDGMLRRERKLADGSYRDAYWMSLFFEKATAERPGRGKNDA